MCNQENFSHCMKVRWSPVLLEVNLNDFFGDHAKTCMTASALSLLVELLFLQHQSFNTYCTIPLISSLSQILVIVILVGGGVPNSILQRRCFQQHSLLSNNTSVTTYVHRMIISLSCLFKHMKNDEHVTMFFQCLLDHTQQKLYFCLISLLRNNVSKRHEYL